MREGETMYYEYWGLNRHPFDNVPDPTMYFRAHESVETAVAEVLFAIEEGDDCLAVIVGEVGLGKTTSLRVILDSLDHSKYRIAFVTNPDVTFTMMLRDIIGQLRNEVCAITRKDDLLEEFNRLLFATADEGKRIVIFVDEGNAFKSANLESLRLLTNMQMDDRNLFTIVLAGQPKLAKMLEAPRHANLFQRVGVYCRLEKMPSWEVVRDYIDHRLERAGATRRIFSDDAIKALYEYSENGVPRLVNKIAKLSLKAGETNQVQEIGRDLVAAIGERFRRVTRAEKAAKAAQKAAAEPPVGARPMEGEFIAAATAKAGPSEEVLRAPEEPAPVSFEMPVERTQGDVAAPAREQEPVPVTASTSSEAYAELRHHPSEPEVRAPEDETIGKGPMMYLTQVCLDEALRPEVMERARAANKVERIKMAGQLAAEGIKKHPEVANGGSDPVVMWKELRNEILSAFAAEVNS